MTTGTFTCAECRRTIGPDDADHPRLAPADVREGMLRHRTCRACEFWRSLVTIRHENRSVRSQGVQFLIAPEPGPSASPAARRGLGFDGQAFTVRFTDAGGRAAGRAEPVVVTHNLNWIGVIPPHFRGRLPDNAQVEEGEPGDDLAALARAAGLRSWDGALPADWVEHARALVGETPLGRGIVWSYDQDGIVGRPAALTAGARAFLARYEALASRARR